MGNIAADLKTYLKTKTAVTDLIGSGTAARIYQDTGKQGVALPYVLFEQLSGESEEHLGGISGIAENLFEVSCYAATQSGAYALSEAVRLAPLQTYRGVMGASYVRVIADSASAGHDPPVKGGNQRRYFERRYYRIIHDEATV